MRRSLAGEQRQQDKRHMQQFAHLLIPSNPP
jgi:hypothetical protein